MKKLLILFLLSPVFLKAQNGSISSDHTNNVLKDSTTIYHISRTDLQLLLQKQDSMIQTYLMNMESRLIEKQRINMDSSIEKLYTRMQSDSTSLYKSVDNIQALVKNDSAITQKLLDAFEEKSKNDAAFFRQISASGKILSDQDSIFLFRLDSAVTINLNETDHILTILKQESTFLDTYINLSLFTLGLIGGNLLNGNENWGFYVAEAAGGLLAWKAISGKHRIDDEISDMQQINDALNEIHLNIKYFRRQIVQYNNKYPSFLSEKIPLVQKKYELVTLSPQLNSIFEGSNLKRGSVRYQLLLRSNSWLNMFAASIFHKASGPSSKKYKAVVKEAKHKR